MKLTKRLTVIFTIVFFTGMAVLTLTARRIHKASLPEVTAAPLTNEYFSFEYTDENGRVQTGSRGNLAIPAELAEKPVFILYRGIKNGEERDFVREAHIAAGAEENGFYEVISGVSFGDRVITESSRELKDNDEVYVR